jgi:hypothetical protein
MILEDVPKNMDSGGAQSQQLIHYNHLSIHPTRFSFIFAPCFQFVFRLLKILEPLIAPSFGRLFFMHIPTNP